MGERLVDPFDMVLGERVRLIRSARRMPLKELSRRIGVTYQQLQKYQTGKNRISASTLWRIAVALNVDVGAFFAAESPIDPDLMRSDHLNPNVQEALCALIDVLADRLA